MDVLLESRASDEVLLEYCQIDFEGLVVLALIFEVKGQVEVLVDLFVSQLFALVNDSSILSCVA